MTFEQFIRQKRIAKGYTADGMAFKLYMSAMTYRNRENGRYDWQLHDVILLQKIFGFTFADMDELEWR